MRDQEWDPTTTKLNTLDFAQFVLGFLSLDSVDCEAALGIVDKTEVLSGLLDRDDVHEAGRIGKVSANLAVYFDKALHEDRLGLAIVERILEAIPDEHNQGQAVAELVRTSRGLGGVDTGQFVEKPVGRRAEALLVLLARSLSGP